MFERVAGPDLGPELAGFDIWAASGPELAEALAASQRAVSWLQARQAELVAEVVAREPAVSASFAGDAFDVAVHEVAAAWTWSVRAAQARVDGCLEVAGRPAVLAALREGRLDWARAVAVAESVGALASRPGMAHAADAVEADALERAGGRTAPQVRAVLARLVLRADPAAADARHQEARRERFVGVAAREDGMAELRALLTAPDALRVYAALGEAGWAARCANRDARREEAARAAAPGEPTLDHGPLPTLDQCRADALVDLLCGTGGRPVAPEGAAGARGVAVEGAAGGRGAGPAGAGVAFRPGGARPPADPSEAPAGTRARGPRPQILVTVPAGTLLGLGGEPAHLAGHGPIPDSLARELAQDGVWRRVLTDPATGAVLDVGRSQHDPPADLERYVRIRDGMCRFPGCRRQAAGCDLDHLVPYPEGETSAANMHALCRRHHRLKHEAGWQVRALPGNTLEWTSPLGAIYTTHPPLPGDEAHTTARTMAHTQRAPAHPPHLKPARAAVIDIERRSPVEVALELAGCA